MIEMHKKLLPQSIFLTALHQSISLKGGHIMKGKKILSISIATACLLMNTPLSVFAVGNTGANEVRFTDTSSAADIQVAVSVPQTAAIPAVKAAAPAPTTAEPYTLTIDDVNVVQCREDDGDSGSPLIDALWIQGIKGNVDFSDAKYKNIVIPETLPFEVPDLDEDGKEQKDEAGNVIMKTVEMPVIKFGIDFNQTPRDNIEKLTVSKNLIAFTSDFAGCKNLSEIIIPEDAALESFYGGGYSKGMFNGTALSSVTIPANLTEVPDKMFINCNTLRSVTFAPDCKLKRIGDFAFSGTSLESIEIPATVTEIGEGAFGMNYDSAYVSNCLFEEIVLPDSMESVPDKCFWGCSKLNKVTFGKNVTHLGDDSFKGTALTEVTIPDSVTSLGNGVFGDIPTLTTVTIGSGIKRLHNIFAGSDNIAVVNLSEGLEAIGENTFGCKQIKTITIPSTVKTIYGGAFRECPELEEIIFTEGSQIEDIGSDNFTNDDPLAGLGGYHYWGAFQGCTSLKDLKLPISTTPFTVGRSSFEGCSSLRSVDLGNCKVVDPQVHDIYENHYGGRAFFGCSKLTDIKFSENLEQIGKDSFGECVSLLGPLVFPDTLQIIGDGAFNGCSAVEDVTFNEGLGEIGGLAFTRCDLHEINLPDTVKEVGDRCFEGNLHVEKVKFSANMTVIPDRFLDCYAQDVAAYSVGQGSHTNVGQHGILKELIIPDNIKEIGIDAFDGALDLEYLDLGKVEYIAPGAFSIHYLLLDELGIEHGSLKTVVMSPCLKEIGTIPPHSVDFEASVYAGVFDGQGDFDGLVLPATLEKVGAYTFNGCAAIKEFTMTENLKSVGSHAFDGCTNLTALTFADTANTKFEDEVFKNCKGLTEVALPSWLETVPVGMFSGCRELTEVTLSEGVSHLGGMAFADTGLTSLTLPESCLYVDDAAFQNAPLSSVTFGSKTVSIGANAFVRDTNVDLMASVFIPETVKSIGEKAFGYYKDTDKNYEELCAEAERLEAETGEHVYVQIPPTIAKTDFILYGYTAAERYAKENGMIYGGTAGIDDPQTTTTTETSTTTTTTTETTSTTTTDTTSATETTSTEQSTTTSSTTTESTITTTDEQTVSVSPYEMSNWAKTDYFKKTGVEPYASTYTENDDGTLTITLLDEAGNVLDKYTVHPNTGIGFNSSGEAVDLPQTGINTTSHLLIMIGAFLMLGFGAAAVWISDIGRRREEDEG